MNASSDVQVSRRRAAVEHCDVDCVHPEKVTRVRAHLPEAEHRDLLAETYRALGDPTRLTLVAALSQGELCVCDLATLLGVSQSVVSHSLRTLRQLRLVRSRREGRIIYYALDDEHISSLLAIGLRHVREA